MAAFPSVLLANEAYKRSSLSTSAMLVRRRLSVIHGMSFHIQRTGLIILNIEVVVLPSVSPVVRNWVQPFNCRTRLSGHRLTNIQICLDMQLSYFRAMYSPKLRNTCKAFWHMVRTYKGYIDSKTLHKYCAAACIAFVHGKILETVTQAAVKYY